MRLGICIYSIDNIATAQKAGFDYFEFPFFELVAMPESEFTRMRDIVNSLQFFPEVMVKMVETAQHLTGENVDTDSLRVYCQKGFERCAQLGVKGFVFGSNGARNMPAGFIDRKKAYDQLADFLLMVSDMAKPYSFEFYIEPLMIRSMKGTISTNIIALIGEAAYLALRVGRENVKIMVDYYHSTHNDENMRIIPMVGQLLGHLHFSTLDRKYPSPTDGGDYGEFFAMVRQAGYDGRITVESPTPANFEEAGALACKRLAPYL